MALMIFRKDQVLQELTVKNLKDLLETLMRTWIEYELQLERFLNILEADFPLSWMDDDKRDLVIKIILKILKTLRFKISEEEWENTGTIFGCYFICLSTKDCLEFPHLFKNLFEAYLKDKRKSENRVRNYQIQIFDQITKKMYAWLWIARCKAAQNLEFFKAAYD